MKRRWLLVMSLAACLLPQTSLAGDEQPWVVYDGFDGPGKGKHIVLVSGDEEYRSEETLPQLGKILAKQHGFRCTVLFAIDPKTGAINPDINNNIPGLESLKSADLMIIFTRFRDLPEEQMKHVVAYVEAGKPIVGLRTATHAFAFSKNKNYLKYTWNGKDWDGGFGRQVLGETWITHHVPNGKGSTRGLVAKGQENHPILRGIKDGDIWGPSGIYGVRLPMLKDCQPLVMGQALTGMKPTDPPVVGKYNDPMMPVAWTHTYRAPKDKAVRTFTTTMGASEDLASEGLRRLLVNASHWALGMEGAIAPRTKVDLVGEFRPSPYRFRGFVKDIKPASLKLP